jgi:hypothetical protein
MTDPPIVPPNVAGSAAETNPVAFASVKERPNGEVYVSVPFLKVA